MIWQHRYGAPARPRNADNTVWDADVSFDWTDALFLLVLAVAIGCAVMGVTAWADVPMGAVS